MSPSPVRADKPQLRRNVCNAELQVQPSFLLVYFRSASGWRMNSQHFASAGAWWWLPHPATRGCTPRCSTSNAPRMRTCSGSAPEPLRVVLSPAMPSFRGWIDVPAEFEASQDRLRCARRHDRRLFEEDPPCVQSSAQRASPVVWIGSISRSPVSQKTVQLGRRAWWAISRLRESSTGRVRQLQDQNYFLTIGRGYRFTHKGGTVSPIRRGYRFTQDNYPAPQAYPLQRLNEAAAPSVR